MAGNPRPRPPPAPPASDEQKQFLLAFMEHHVLFSQGEFRCAMGKEEQRKEWGQLKVTLNAIPGGSEKTMAKWQVVCMPYVFLYKFIDFLY